MNIVDVIILLVLVADIVRGGTIGFVRQFFSFAGFWGGLLVAPLIAPWAASYAHTTLNKLIVIVVVILVVASVLGGIAESLATYLSRFVGKPLIGKLNALLGAVFGAGLVLLSTWLIASMLLNVPVAGLSQALQQSRIVRGLDQVLPPAPSFIARVQHIIDPNGFPQVFVGPEPTPGGPVAVATTTQVNQAIAAARPSTVQIEGFGCGGEVFGSGFVAADGFVVTNAHVVAGIARPMVLDQEGLHTAVPVLFDPNLDIAILRVDLTDPPLRMSTQVAANGTQAVAMGYPGGGPFTASPAGVIQNYIATGRNIYDEGITARDVYELEAVVRPGNSGGPLVLPDGTVVGVVFARSQANNSVGYALTSAEVLPKLSAAEASDSPVSTGTCAAD